MRLKEHILSLKTANNYLIFGYCLEEKQLNSFSKNLKEDIQICLI